MGIYYVIACDKLKEKIDPGSINDLGMQQHAIAHLKHPFGSVVIFALVTRWCNQTARIANDYNDDPGYYEYTDITQQIINEYNTEYGTTLQFTGEKEL